MNEILIIVVLMLLNGVFAMSEMAMVASRRSRLSVAAGKGDRAARRAFELSGNPGKFLSTVQVGITLISILIGIFSAERIEGDLQNFLGAYPWLAPYKEGLAVAVMLTVLTFCSMVLGELVPKRIGLAMPESIAKVLAFPMYWLSILAAPFVWLLTKSTDLLIRLLRIKGPVASLVTEEEIKALVTEGTETGVIREIEKSIVENVFHLGDRRVETLMTHRHEIVWLNALESPETNKNKLINSDHKSFPVCDGTLDRVLGVLHAKEKLASVLKGEALDFRRSLLPALYVGRETSAYDALTEFRKTRQRLALVTGPGNAIVGVLTMTDIVDALMLDLADQLHERKEIVVRGDGSFLVDASLSVYEFGRYFGIDASRDEFLSTISTVEEMVRRLDQKEIRTGQTFRWREMVIEIVDMDGSRIDKLLIQRTVGTDRPS